MEKIRKYINQSHHNKSGVEEIVVLFNFQFSDSKNKLLETKMKPKYENNLSKITCDLKRSRCDVWQMTILSSTIKMVLVRLISD